MTMREKMARAIAKNINEHQLETGFAFDGDFRDGIDGDWEEYLSTADAALDALMEPSEALIDAAYLAYFPEMNCQVGIRKACIAMIAAAKAGK